MKKLLVVVLTCFFSTTAYSDTPTSWAEQQDKKFFKSMQFSSGLHHIKKFAETQEQIPEIQKVGILAFSIYQPATKKVKSSYTSGGVRYESIYAPYITEEGVSAFTYIIYEAALPAMKESFSEQGIELLTPDEYLDTPEKKALFDDTQIQNSGTWEAVIAFVNRLNARATPAVPDGQKFVLLANADAAIWRSVGKLAGELGLDALLVVESTYSFDYAAQIALRKIDMSLIGPNTVPYAEASVKKYAPFGPLEGYLEGIVYGNLAGLYSKGALLIARVEEDRYTETHFENIDVLYGRISRQLIVDTNVEVEKFRNKIK